jgi:hypothetical protein
MIFTEIIAGVALIFSAISLLWQWNDKRLRLYINPRVVYRELPISFTEQNIINVLSIHISNPGEKPIYIEDVLLMANKGQEIQLFQYNTLYQRLPESFILESHRGKEYIVGVKPLIEDLKAKDIKGNIYVAICVKDEINKCYKSKSFLFSTGQLGLVKS